MQWQVDYAKFVDRGALEHMVGGKSPNIAIVVREEGLGWPGCTSTNGVTQ